MVYTPYGMVYTLHGIYSTWYTLYMVYHSYGSHMWVSSKNLSALFAADYILYTGGLFVNVKITKWNLQMFM